jgi:predicted RNA-binding Zn-ribbon protein involved in translation (DUF1610 family)
MLAMEFTRASDEYATVLPPCPNCGRQMLLNRTMPRSSGLPDLCVFKCDGCGVWLIESASEHRM